MSKSRYVGISLNRELFSPDILIILYNFITAMSLSELRVCQHLKTRPRKYTFINATFFDAVVFRTVLVPIPCTFRE